MLETKPTILMINVENRIAMNIMNAIPTMVPRQVRMFLPKE